MIGASALIFLIGLSPLAHAERKAEIFCKAKTAFADAGAIVEIEKQEDGSLLYSYTKNSFAGPQLVAKFPVTVEATKPDKDSCELDITKNADGSHRFFVKQITAKKWNMVLPKSQKEGEMACEVKESLRTQLCHADEAESSGAN